MSLFKCLFGQERRTSAVPSLESSDGLPLEFLSNDEFLSHSLIKFACKSHQWTASNLSQKVRLIAQRLSRKRRSRDGRMSLSRRLCDRQDADSGSQTGLRAREKVTIQLGILFGNQCPKEGGVAAKTRMRSRGRRELSEEMVQRIARGFRFPAPHTQPDINSFLIHFLISYFMCVPLGPRIHGRDRCPGH